jgi:tRNA(Ile)-lysidine synthase
MRDQQQGELHKQVAATLQRYQMAPPGTRLGVAVSGGADSVALLLLLCDLRQPLGLSLAVLHFHHQLRGADSDGDEQFVAGLAQQWGLEFLGGREDVAETAQREGSNLEETARQLRRAFFERAVAGGSVTRVATAHTLDDQAETVLAHLLRGTGITGLAGIHPVAGPVVRPLLETRRGELRRFLTERGQAWREDATNQDTARLRARVRHILLPLLEREFAPAAVERLARVAAHARREESFWEQLWERRLPSLAEHDGSLSVTTTELFDPAGWRARHSDSSALDPDHAGARRFVRRIYQELTGGVAGLTATHVEQVLRLAAGGVGRRIELPRGVQVERAPAERLVFTLPRARTARPPQPYHYVVALNGAEAAVVTVPEAGLRLCLGGIDWPAQGSDTSKEPAHALDANRLRAPLILRSWQPGDAYRPRGRRHAHKLKRLFWEQGVPARQRASWPVLEAGGQVVWVRGFGPAEEAAPGQSTRRAIVIREEQI